MTGRDMLDDDDRAACAVASDWLATAPGWSMLAAAAAAAIVAGVVDGGSPHALWPGALLGLIERVLGLRVALDARLFDRLAHGSLGTLALLDSGLARVLRVPAAKSGRPLEPRLEGALRLYRAHAWSAALMLLPATFAWFHRIF